MQATSQCWPAAIELMGKHIKCIMYTQYTHSIMLINFRYVGEHDDIHLYMMVDIEDHHFALLDRSYA